MSYENVIKYLYNLQPIGIKFGLSNTLSLLHYFHNPHLQIKTIHVAGTNGKGSVCAMLSAILRMAGYKVGLYTSPHLTNFTERISINGHPISHSDVIRITEKIQDAVQERNFQSSHPTFFEVVTVMALVYFAEQQVDLAIMEVGMGGRLDATNVIQPLIGIITTIDLDHQQYLGNSLVDIAKEKAGIIKKGMKVVVGACQPEIFQLLRQTCRERNADLIQVSPLSDVHILHQDLLGQSFEVLTPGSAPQRYSISLLGRHQIQNSLTALAAAQKLSELLPRPLSPRQIAEGLSLARWPGRIEVYSGSPSIIVDGAHNPAAAHQLSLFLKELGWADIILILGIMKDKEIDKICQELVPLASGVILTRPKIARAALPEEILHIVLSQSFKHHSKKFFTTENVPEAIVLAKTLAGPRSMICITGSLYTAGEAKEVLDAS